MAQFILALFLVFGGAAASAENHEDEAESSVWPLDIGIHQLFLVNVSGDLRGGGTYSEAGTAFAIGRNTLMTAHHVVGDPFSFEQKFMQLMSPERKISAVTSKERNSANNDVDRFPGGFAASSPIQTVDAARIDFPDGIDTRPFALSACKPKSAKEEFRAIIFHPRTGTKTPVELTLRYDPTTTSKLTGAAVFVNTSDAWIIQKGNSGAPVLNNKNEVIGLVSQREDAEAVKKHVHVTLTEAFLPLIPKDIMVDCTDRNVEHRVAVLESSVERIDKLVSENATRLEQQSELLRFQTRRLDRLQYDLTQLKDEVNRLTVKQRSTGSVAEMTMKTLTDNNDFIEYLRSVFGETEDIKQKQQEIEAEMERLAVQAGLTDQPLVPAVYTMRQHLSRENWSMTVTSGAFGADFALSYERDFAVAPFSQSMEFCFAPFLPLPEDSTSRQNYKKQDFYSLVNLSDLEKARNSGNLNDLHYRCLGSSHTEARVEQSKVANSDSDEVLGGVYLHSLRSRDMALVATEKLKNLKAEQSTLRRVSDDAYWNGVGYLAVIKPADTFSGERTIKHYLVDLEPLGEEGYDTNSAVIPCLEFDGIESITELLEEVTVYPKEDTLAQNAGANSESANKPPLVLEQSKPKTPTDIPACVQKS
ncbi:trypsin-like peptidase domain-containing protein [Ruegeria sp. HKCCD7255]|uniref:trypsin-like peptidase domain-containing protein n=1 Tax=Ruegeria sp. HKCCD7255 TaxID=2683004 RepID=UPI0014893642|nr:trypsin-like peptidase domain-containing protein [Ruegeria sp. HKCCD7255]